MRQPSFAPSIPLGPAREPLFDLEIDVVTPLFGGSATAGKVDPEFPIRGASIRGHLRFWWRACRGAGYDSPDALFAQEKAIWGSTDTPAAIELEVTVLRSGKTFRYGDGPAYVLFPFRENKEDGLTGVQFRLTLYASVGAKRTREELRAEAETALWAWLTFGGIGARTRRGCGSLWCGHEDFIPRQPLKAWLQDKARQHVRPGDGGAMLPRLHRAAAFVGKGPVRQPAQAWREAIEVLSGFRQGRDLGKWPEADSIRLADGMRLRRSHPAAPYFPRADLGLPIIFHFKSHGDPEGYRLEGAREGATRMASPVIVKPLALSPTQAVPAVLVLRAPNVWSNEAPGVELKGPRGRRLGRSELHDRAKADQVQAIGALLGGKDQYGARAAFVEHVRWSKFEGVIL